MARLRAAVDRSPRAQAVEAEEEPAEAERPRFGIGSLINRMAGGGSDHDRSAAASRKQPQVHSSATPAESKELSPEQERIEIPAFLRRQAN